MISSPPSPLVDAVKGSGTSFGVQRVAEVRRRIEQGTYRIDIPRIASGMASQVAFTLPFDASVRGCA